MSKQLLVAAGAGVLSAFFYASVTSGAISAFILAYFAQLPLFLVGLALGTAPGAVAGAAGILVTGAYGGALAALLFALVNAVPALLVLRQALQSRAGPGGGGTTEWYPPGLLITWVIGFGTIVFFVGAWALYSDSGGIEAGIRRFLTGAMAQLFAASGDARAAGIADRVAPFFPAAVVGSWAVMVTLNAILAQGALVRFQRNIRPSPSLARLELPNFMLAALLIAVPMAILGGGSIGFVGRNLLIILAIPYFFQGLAVVHWFSHRLPNRGMWLTLFYVALLLFSWLALMIAGLGIVEQGAKIRQRLAGPQPD